MSLSQPPSDAFNQRVEGTWGEFKSPAGRVTYLMTNARLGGNTGADWERRLTRHLRPVREVLDVKHMEFDELLQRDLDDHRVASELVPYILGQRTKGMAPAGPAFFPPILALLLPSGVDDVSTFFPSPGPDIAVRHDGLPFAETRFGHSFVVRRLLLDPGDDPVDLHTIRYGMVEWSDDRAKLVVIDGQHRAMALLAIERTRRREWEDTSGSRYRHFYEKRVTEALATDSSVIVQVPVTVCWFPELLGDAVSPVRAARKLFVDVNKRAKRPSEDRVILLSDDDLVNIFTQSLLNLLPRRPEGMPLFAVEYDSPESHRGPGRWSVVTTLQSLRIIVERLVFGPAKYIESVDEEMKGRPPDDGGSFLRKQLRIEKVLSALTADEEEAVPRGSLNRQRFPRSQSDELRSAFNATWGDAVVRLFAGTEPYRAHCAALSRLYNEAPANTGVEQLAREAIFEGVGMYWTLSKAANSWTVSQRIDASLEKTDVVRAWELVRGQQDLFSEMRATEYLGSAAASSVRLADHLFNDVFKTQACQLGLALTFGTIAHLADIRDERLPELATQVAATLNDALKLESASGLPLRIAFAKADSGLTQPTINSIVRMNTLRAIEFRYFWFELLLMSEVAGRLAPYVKRSVLTRQRDRARRLFLVYRIGEQTKALRSLGDGKSETWLQTQATAQIVAQLSAALSLWFDISRDESQAWLIGLDDLITTSSSDSDTDADGPDDDSSYE